MVSISKRAKDIPASPIRRLANLALRVKTSGIHVHHLNIGQPDIPTPREALNAFHNFEDEVLAYGPSEGIPELRQAIAEYWQKAGVGITQEDVLVTIGGSEAVVFAFDAVADPGEQVLTIEPYYANYLGFATVGGVDLLTVPSYASNGFRLPSDEELQKRLTPKTRAILICSPGNPTGVVYTPEEMHRLGRFVERHNLFLISDEVYREFNYGECTATSALSLPCAFERVIVVDSISKRFSACGARIGSLVSFNKEVIAAVLRMAFARLCPATADQLAALAAYKAADRYLPEVIQEYKHRREVLVGGLNKIPGVSCFPPDGAFYTIATLPVDDGDSFCEWLLSQFSLGGETVMLAPASGFYSNPDLGRKQVRIAYVLGEAALRKSLAIIEAGLAQYPGRTL